MVWGEGDYSRGFLLTQRSLSPGAGPDRVGAGTGRRRGSKMRGAGRTLLPRFWVRLFFGFGEGEAGGGFDAALFNVDGDTFVG